MKALATLLCLIGFVSPLAASDAPEPPKFGAPGDRIFYSTVAVKHPKKSEDRAQGGPNHLFFTAWLPDGVERVRGIYHTPLNLDTVEKAHSRAMAAHWGFAIVGGNYMRAHRDDFLPSLTSGLAEMAEKSGHPELNSVPVILSGMSAGAGMCVTLAELMPERVIACALVCLEVGPETEKTRGIPMLTIFGEKDGQQMEKLSAKLPERRAAFDAAWGIAPQWNRKHEWGHANQLLWPFFEDVLAQRLPPGAANLLPIDPAKGWLADPGTWTMAASAAAYSGEQAKAAWLPGENSARVWQAFVVKKPLLRIVDPVPQGDGKPLTIVKPGTEVAIRAVAEKSLPPGGTWTLFDGAISLAEATPVDGAAEFRMPDLPSGFHTFHVKVGLADGRTELSRPVSILIR